MGQELFGNQLVRVGVPVFVVFAKNDVAVVIRARRRQNLRADFHAAPSFIAENAKLIPVELREVRNHMASPCRLLSMRSENRSSAFKPQPKISESWRGLRRRGTLAGVAPPDGGRPNNTFRLPNYAKSNPAESGTAGG